MRCSRLFLIATLAVSPAGAQLPRPGGLAVLVREMERGNPLPAAVVTITLPGSEGSQRAVADSTGFARFRDLPGGKYTLSATAAGYDSYTWLHQMAGTRLDTLQVNLRKVVAGADGTVPDSARTVSCNALLATGWGYPARPDACAFLRTSGMCPACETKQDKELDLLLPPDRPRWP